MKNEILAHLKDSYGLEESDLADIYECFLADLQDQVSQLEALSQNPPDDEAFCLALRTSCHTILGFCANVGANEILEKLSPLHEAARAGNAQESLRLMPALLAICNAFLHE